MQDTAVVDLLVALLDGADFAAAQMLWNAPGPIRLPETLSARRTLVVAHMNRRPATVVYAPIGKPEAQDAVDPVVLTAFCLAADRRCRWIAVDLDAADGHGDGGLVDPAHAARCIAERADACGLSDGVFVNRSGGARGLHIWLVLPRPTTLDDASLGLATLIAAAYDIADDDTRDYEAPHAFRTAAGTIAEPGTAGAVELRPHSTERPACGWTMVLPGAGAFAHRGGGVLLDPFTGLPCRLTAVPRCGADAWDRLVTEARGRIQLIEPAQRQSSRRRSAGDPLAHLHPLTRTFLAVEVTQDRNNVLFAAMCNLLGCGVAPAQAEALALDAALRCGLPEREARSTILSAMRTMMRRK